jgi:hypothetical protein
MNRLLEWEKGRARIESASVTAFLARALEVYNYAQACTVYLRVFSYLHDV